MIIDLPVNNIPFTVVVGVKTKQPERITLIVEDKNISHTPYMYYGAMEVKGYREFYLKFPSPPKAMYLSIFNSKYRNNPKGDSTFAITKMEVKSLGKNPIWLTDADREFLDFATKFSKRAKILKSGRCDNPVVYRSKNLHYFIRYCDVITSRFSNEPLTTPARVGHETGIIDVSKKEIWNKTVSSILLYLLHEYSHKYKNPKINLEIGNEYAADLNALWIYLSEGYPIHEIIPAFALIFKKANTEWNRRRLAYIWKFVNDFAEGKLKNKIPKYQ